MKRLLAVLLCICAVFSFSGLAESGRRGSVEIINEEIEDEFAEDDGLNLDPDEEFEFDSDVINTAFDTLDSVRNILLIGMDSRGKSISGRTDTMMLLSVDIENRKIRLISFLRDTYVEIPGYKNNRLNSAYAQGGFELLAKTLYKNFGVKPDAYVAVNLSGLVNVIDQLGGIDVDVPAGKIDRVNAVIYWYNIQVLGLSNTRDGFLTRGGLQHLNGKQAEAWARYRYSESDFQRSARQRQLITILFDKICEMSVADLSAFVVKNVSLVKTNMSVTDLVALAPAVLAMKDSEITQLQIPLSSAYSAKTISGMAVLVPDRQKNADAIRKFMSE